MWRHIITCSRNPFVRFVNSCRDRLILLQQPLQKQAVLSRFRARVTKKLQPIDEYIFNVLTIGLAYALQWWFLADLLRLGLTLFVENGLVYVASSYQLVRYTPLRDLVRDTMLYKPTDPNLTYADLYTDSEHDFWINRDSYGWWLNKGPLNWFIDRIFDGHILIWIVLSVLFLQRGMQILHRGIRTLALVRFMRWFTFTITIIPSPRGPHCQVSRGFDKEITSFWEVARALLQIRTGGGCHDLLFSGHAVMYTLSAITVWVLLMRNDGEATTPSPRNSTSTTTSTTTTTTTTTTTMMTTTTMTNESFSRIPRGSGPIATAAASNASSSSSVSRWTPLFFGKLAICIVYSLILIQKAFQTVGSGHHYSMDIIVAFYMTILVWHTPYATWHCTPPTLSTPPQHLGYEALDFNSEFAKLEEGRLRRRSCSPFDNTATVSCFI